MTPAPGAAVTRSQAISQMAFQAGSFYAINAADYSDGFCISKCLKSNLGFFDGTFLKKSSEMVDLVLFEETKKTGRFESEKVNSMLISIAPLQNSKGQYCVKMDEIEQIISSLD